MRDYDNSRKRNKKRERFLKWEKVTHVYMLKKRLLVALTSLFLGLFFSLDLGKGVNTKNYWENTMNFKEYENRIKMHGVTEGILLKSIKN